MKKILSFISAVLLLSVALSFIACEKNDESTPEPEAPPTLAGLYTFGERVVNITCGYFYVYSGSMVFRLAPRKNDLSTDYIQLAIMTKFCDGKEYTFEDATAFSYIASYEDGLYFFPSTSLSGKFCITKSAIGLYDVKIDAKLYPEAGKKFVIDAKAVPLRTE